MGCDHISVVEPFTTIVGTEHAGMTAYYRAPDCNSITIADVLPLLSKITHYEDEYIIGEMLIWDTGSISGTPNNCVMTRVIIYNDGWICAWFDKTTQNQIALSGAQYVNSTTLSGWGTSLEYVNKYNGFNLKIAGSTDPDCPADSVFTIQNTDMINGQVTIHRNDADSCFHSGYTYNTEIYSSNGNMLWWDATSSENAIPPYKSNRLYRAIYQLWEVLRERSNSTNLEQIDASRVYSHDYSSGIYTDETIDFNDIGSNDVSPWGSSEGVNDAFYIGSPHIFEEVWINMYSYAVGSDMLWEYYNGSSWVTLPCVDGTSKFTTNGTVSFSPPVDWAKTTVNSYEHYWIRARVIVAGYTTTPTITQGQLGVQAPIEYTDTELGLYNFEFTGANYCLLSGKNNSTISSPYYSYYYNTVLPGKVIYDCVMNHGSYNYSSGTKLYINDHLIFDAFAGFRTNGYLNLSLMDYVYEAGIQNMFTIFGYGYLYSKAATVLLVS